MDERVSLFGNKVKTNWNRIYSSIFITTLVIFTLWMFFIFSTVSDGDLSNVDLSHYVYFEQIDSINQRIIMIGDIHGMKEPFDRLLDQLNYNPDNDLLIALGDLVNKGPQSVEVIQKLNELNAKAVRGNHDQYVIQWYIWFKKVESIQGGKDWIDLGAPKRLRPKGALKVPPGWEWEGPHWQIARDLDESTANYLLNLPVLIHLPEQDLYAVHAGMLSSNPTIPLSYDNPPYTENGLIDIFSVPQNTPSNLIEMRSIDQSGQPTKSNKGLYEWYRIWNKDMRKCQEDINGCHPQRIVYGHAAARGLDLHPYTYGLDTRCFGGGKLTTLIISSNNYETDKKKKIGKGKDGNRFDKSLKFERDVPVSPNTNGQIFSVFCPDLTLN